MNLDIIKKNIKTLYKNALYLSKNNLDNKSNLNFDNSKNYVKVGFEPSGITVEAMIDDKNEALIVMYELYTNLYLDYIFQAMESKHPGIIEEFKTLLKAHQANSPKAKTKKDKNAPIISPLDWAPNTDDVE